MTRIDFRVPDHGEPTAIENLCIEHRVACRGKDYLDEPCVCAIISMGYELARSETWARPGLIIGKPLPWYRRGLRYRIEAHRLRRAYLKDIS